MSTSSANPTITVDGAHCALMNDEWRRPEHQVSLDHCNAVARRFKLGLTGEQVVQRILDHVAARGGAAVNGKEIVRAFGAEVDGARNMDWTAFFKYACNERGLLRYKRVPVSRSSRVYFVLPASEPPSRVARGEGPRLSFTAEFEGSFDVPARDSRTAERNHGLVVNQLAAELRAQGLAPRNTLLIDLLVEMHSGRVALFEVKTSSDRDSIYTCVGQLMVHRGDRTWRQVAVLPHVVRPDLAAALGTLGIDVLTFTIDDRNVRFDGLAALAARLRRDCS